MKRPLFFCLILLPALGLFAAMAVAAKPGADDPFGAAPISTAKPASSTVPSEKPKSGDDDNPSAAVLKEFNVTPDAAGLGEFLRSLHPSEDTQKMVARLIAQLGDDEYATRDGAMKQLLRMPVVPTEQLDKATKGPDPEVRWRSKEILDQSGKKYAAILDGGVKTITYKKVKGLTKELLATIPLCTEANMRHAADKALEATATAADADLLRGVLKQGDVELRVAATAALAEALGDQSAGEMKALLVAPEDRVRITAARALAVQGDRAALAPLGKLLAAEDMNVRLGAINILRGLTGEKFAFVAYEEPATRQKQTERWQKWIADEGASAKLQHPLKEGKADLGRTLISYYGNNRVSELGPDGKETWKVTTVMQPWGCQGLPNGHRLIVSFSLRNAVEFDETGKKVWEATGIPASPFSVERLENGNTLFSCSDSQKLVEVGQDGKQVSEISVPGRPMDAAHRLADGTTLVTLQQGNKVVEVDSKGKELWSLKPLSNPMSARRLENGNTLVTEQGKGRVVEYDRAGKEVWSQGGFPAAYDAERLPNGNTLVAFSQGVREVDHEGKMVWEKLGVMATHVSHF